MPPHAAIYCTARERFEAGDAAYALDADDLKNLDTVWDFHARHYGALGYWEHGVDTEADRVELLRAMTRETAELRAALYFFQEGDAGAMREPAFWRAVWRNITQELRQALAPGIMLKD
jgi:hypothetical protein